MKIGYVISPFRADTAWEIEQNIRNAEQVGFELLKRGCFPIIPHANTRFFHGSFPDDVMLEGTRLLLTRAADFAITVSAIGLTWKRSKGSQAEVLACTLHPLPVFHSFADLQTWLDKGT